MTPERAIELALRRAVTWSDIRVVTELGLVVFRDLAPDLPVQAYLSGEHAGAFDITIEIRRRDL